MKTFYICFLRILFPNIFTTWIRRKIYRSLSQHWKGFFYWRRNGGMKNLQRSNMIFSKQKNEISYFQKHCVLDFSLNCRRTLKFKFIGFLACAFYSLFWLSACLPVKTQTRIFLCWNPIYFLNVFIKIYFLVHYIHVLNQKGINNRSNRYNS